MRAVGTNDRQRPIEQPAVKTTIVGGRPPGPGKQVGTIPRGIEVMVKKASVDAEFRALLLAKRGDAAREIGLELEPAEVAMLDGVPAGHLEAIIAYTTVSPMSRAAFLGRAAAVMLAALGAGAGCGQQEEAKAPRTKGMEPSRVPKPKPATSKPAADQKPPEGPMPPGVALPEVKPSDLDVRVPKVG